jgi:hypothetical protein
MEDHSVEMQVSRRELIDEEIAGLSEDSAS